MAGPIRINRVYSRAKGRLRYELSNQEVVEGSDERGRELRATDEESDEEQGKLPYWETLTSSLEVTSLILTEDEKDTVEEADVINEPQVVLAVHHDGYLGTCSPLEEKWLPLYRYPGNTAGIVPVEKGLARMNTGRTTYLYPRVN